MRVLVTRDPASAARTAAALLRHGHEAVVEPLTRIVPLPYEPFSESAAAIVFTSPAAVLNLGGIAAFQAMTVFAVGERTAETARQAGFGDVISADGDAGDLLALVRSRTPDGARILYPAGSVTAHDLEGELNACGYQVERRVVYRAETAEAFSFSLRAALQAGQIDAVTHFSLTAATTYLALARDAGLRTQGLAPLQLCLSERIAAPLRSTDARVLVSEKPNESTLVALLDGAGSNSPEERPATKTAGRGEAMAKDPMKPKSRDRSSRPQPPVIELPATDITPPASRETIEPMLPPDETTSDASIRADVETGFSAPADETSVASMAASPQSSPPSALDAVSSEFGKEAATASSTETSNFQDPSEEEAAASGGGAARMEPHAIDPAVFDRPGREPRSPSSALGSILLGTLAGVVASVGIVFALMSLELLPGMDARDVHTRLEGVEASIRSLVEQRPGLQGGDLAPASRVDAVDAMARGNEEALGTLRADLKSLADRVAASPAQSGSQGTDLAALTAEVQRLRSDLEATRSGLAALPADLPAQWVDIQTRLTAIGESLATITPQLAGLADKQESLTVMVSELQATAAADADVRQSLDALSARQEEFTAQIRPLQEASKDLGEVRSRFTELNTQVETLSRQGQTPVDQAARQLALVDLLDPAMREGRPFPDILAALRSAGSPDAELDALAPVAEAGIPPSAELGARARAILRGLAPEAAAPAGFLDRLSSSARSLVTITSDAAPRSDLSGARAAFPALLESHDLSGALATFATLDPTARAALADVAALAENRKNAEQALLSLRNAALTALATRS